MRYLLIALIAFAALFAYRQIKKAKAMRLKKENAKNRAILQEILDSRR